MQENGYEPLVDKFHAVWLESTIGELEKNSFDKNRLIADLREFSKALRNPKRGTAWNACADEVDLAISALEGDDIAVAVTAMKSVEDNMEEACDEMFGVPDPSQWEEGNDTE